jgi:hypothetical protein
MLKFNAIKLDFFLIHMITISLKYLGVFFGLLGKIVSFVFNRKAKDIGGIVLETGIRAADSIYFTELYLSLCEFLDNRRKILKFIVLKRSQYLVEVLNFMRFSNIDFYVYDPRTGSQNKYIGLLQALILRFLFGYHQIIPIICLTDASIRQWRYQASLLAGNDGIIYTFLDPTQFGVLFRKINVVGPCFMPLSLETFNKLHKNFDYRFESNNIIYFCGSIYEKRLDFFNTFDQVLKNNTNSVKLKIDAKSTNISSDRYWKNLMEYNLIISTTFQQPTPEYIYDKSEVDQFVFRITEVLACRRVLISTTAPGLNSFLIPGVDYVAIPKDLNSGLNDLIEILNDEGKLKSIAINGNMKMLEYIANKVFWSQIDQRLKNRLI